MADIVEIYWAHDASDAHRIRLLLLAEGIEARVVGETLQGAAGELPMGPAISPRVWVRAEDARQAREVIEGAGEARAQAVQQTGPWTCPDCGADVDAGFDLCWSCQAERPHIRKPPP